MPLYRPFNSSTWTLDQFARHYVETISAPPNGWGQHLSPFFGQSHTILWEAYKRFPEQDVNDAISALLSKES